MIEQILKIELERRKMFLEFVMKAFLGAVVEEIPIPQINKPDGWGLAIRLKSPIHRSINIRPLHPLMTDTRINFLQIFLEGIQTAKNLLNNPPLKEEGFQGTIILGDKGVERFLRSEDVIPKSGIGGT
jgi:hypothetical protein